MAGSAPLWLLGPLQTQSIEVIETQTSVLELAFSVVLLCVGAVLTYQAIRGYRRNDDRSMALFAVGLFLLTVVHASLKLLLEFVLPLFLVEGAALGFTVAATSQLVDVVGLLVVFYAILR